jgi:hypothetical protein
MLLSLAAAGGLAQTLLVPLMCNLYSITTNQAAIAALFRVVNDYLAEPTIPSCLG